MKSKIVIRPIELVDANEFISKYHRHHKPVQGHRFSISAWIDNILVGVAVVGRPVARLAGDPLEVLEVTRLCTNGGSNLCSALYSACARIGKEMGYLKIQTYILDSESGISLKASGWLCDGVFGGGQWKHTDGKDRRTDQPTCKKGRWSRILNERGVILDNFHIK